MSIELLNKCYELDIALKEKQKLQSNWNSLREYIINEFLDGNLEWHRNNSSTISGSDLPNECILELLNKMNELEGADNENNS